MYEKLEKCPACDSTQLANDQIITDHFLTGESFALTRCTKCTLLFTNPRPSETNISKYYNTPDYISHSNSSGTLTHIIYKWVRRFALATKTNLITQRSAQERILDFGTGSGHFLRHLLKQGIDATGVEPYKQLIQYTDTLSSHIYQSLESLPPKQKYTAITAWHVIEHVHELKSTIKALRKKLEKNGFMFIAVPNYKSYDATHYGEYWAGYDVPRHLYHFDPVSFQHLIQRSKLKLIEILPMRFDAYYVSLLSEQYATGNRSYLNALKTGFRSNVKAKTTQQYSSLIYVLQKK